MKYKCVTDGFEIEGCVIDNPDYAEKVSIAKGEVLECVDREYIVKDGVYVCAKNSILGKYHFKKVESEIYDKAIMEAVRQRIGLEKDDTSKDGYIMTLDKRTVFREFCEWNGLLGWSDNILLALENIYDIRLK